MSAVSETQSPEPAPLSVWLGFATMCVGMFMAVLDIQVVATSLPTIQAALNIPPDQMSWIQTGYLIAEIIAIPLTGLLMRALTMRWLFVVATIVFTLASIACAMSGSFVELIACRVVQGFAGGTLIPAVFSAVFILFPLRHQAPATTLAGVVAVLAPTVGPIVGGWITETYSWPWLFLINVVPGIVAAGCAAMALPKALVRLDLFRQMDAVALGIGAVALAALEIAIKEAPERGWTSPLAAGLLALSAIAALAFTARTLRSASPLVDLSAFRDRNFSIGCALSFALGIGLFGSVYLMPVFLAFVRGHNALEIGEVMLVTGIAQLAVAPVAVLMVQRFDLRLLTALGFVVFGVGLGLSALQTKDTDFAGMFWPQVLRGCAVMFCILAPTQLALSHFPKTAVANASGLFNLMRNLGGAIGIAVIDTIIFTRAPEIGNALVVRLTNGDLETARALGLRPEDLGPALLEPDKQAMLAPLIKQLAYVDAINDAWAAVAVATLIVLAIVPLARPTGQSRP